MRTRGSPVDFISQDDVGENGTLHEPEITLARRILVNNLSAGDVTRHQIWCELNAAEFELEGAGECSDEKRLGEPRYAHEQYMPVGQQADKNLLNNLLLADDDLGNLLPEGLQSVLYLV